MRPDLKLGYLVFEASRPRDWTTFLCGTVGLPAPFANPDGSEGFRVDAALQRLIVAPGPADDLGALGFEAADEQVLEAVVARARGCGIAVHEVAPARREARRVRALFELRDPAGNCIELFAGPEAAATPFASQLVPGGFRTGELGLGHAVLNWHDAAAMERFYTAALGFAVTERLDARVGPLDVRGTFMHCNRRHHSLALFALPLKKRLHHFMLQAERTMDVGLACERARARGVPQSLSLGQHPDPDGTLSFYGVTPSGFDFEIGAGSAEIEPQGWHAHTATVTSRWGHKPSLRAQWQLARGLAAQRLRLPGAVPAPVVQGVAAASVRA